MKVEWQLDDAGRFDQLFIDGKFCAEYEITGDVYKIQYLLRNDVVNDWVLQEDLGDDIRGYIEWQFEHLITSEVVDEPSRFYSH